jgi:hypothetical protein
MAFLGLPAMADVDWPPGVPRRLDRFIETCDWYRCVRTRRRLSSAGLIHPRRMRRWLWDSRCGPAWMPESQSTIAWSSTPTDSGCYRNGGLEPVGGVGGVGAAISASTRVRCSSSGAQRWVLAVSSTLGALRRTAASFNRRKARSRSGGSGGIFLRSAPGVVLGVTAPRFMRRRSATSARSRAR